MVGGCAGAHGGGVWWGCVGGGGGGEGRGGEERGGVGCGTSKHNQSNNTTGPVAEPRPCLSNLNHRYQGVHIQDLGQLASDNNCRMRQTMML